MTTHSLDDLLSLLIDQDAIIVHCAGFAKGVGNDETNGLDYLQRLHRAIVGDVELSCSTVVPGDMNDFSKMNYTGKVGLVLRPNSSASITFASESDVGSQIDPRDSKRRFTGLPSATLELIQTAITDRPPNTYNELGVMDYSVIGVFIDPPIQYVSETGLHSIELRDVAKAFSAVRLFLLRGGQLHDLVSEDGRLTQGNVVSIASLYRPQCAQ